ncbi:hypothetical protein TruAng_000141 [Truncatella angustata]|nr:hypothetical protein TruAng_000141 [Truncatella angustata]
MIQMCRKAQEAYIEQARLIGCEAPEVDPRYDRSRRRNTCGSQRKKTIELEYYCSRECEQNHKYNVPRPWSWSYLAVTHEPESGAEAASAVIGVNVPGGSPKPLRRSEYYSQARWFLTHQKSIDMASTADEMHDEEDEKISKPETSQPKLLRKVLMRNTRDTLNTVDWGAMMFGPGHEKDEEAQ